MRIGVISEGHSDRAIISNLLIAATGIQRTEIVPLRPILKMDVTDKASKDPAEFSNWTLVKKECEERELIDGFLSLEGQDYVVVHIDTAEADDYGVQRPVKDADYAKNLRTLVIAKMHAWINKKEWTEGNNSAAILYAVAVEETESWLLCIYWNAKDTSTSAKPKEKLKYFLGQKRIDATVDYANYLKLSKPFAKHSDIVAGKFLERNQSLELFYTELTNLAKPEEKED